MQPVDKGHTAQKHTLVIQMVHFTVVENVQHKMVKSQMPQEVAGGMRTGNNINMFWITLFRTICLTDFTTGCFVTYNLITVFEDIADLFVGILVEGFDDNCTDRKM